METFIHRTTPEIVDGKRRRAKREDVLIRQRARAVLDPMTNRIGEWQVAVARLHLMLTRPQCTIEQRQRVVEQIARIRQEVMISRSDLSRLVADLPPKAAQSSWVGDAAMGLSSLEQRLGEINLLN